MKKTVYAVEFECGAEQLYKEFENLGDGRILCVGHLAPLVYDKDTGFDERYASDVVETENWVNIRNEVYEVVEYEQGDDDD